MGDVSGGTGWVIAVNLVLWTGLFLYLLRLDRQVRRAERAASTAARPDDNIGGRSER